jgi:hypothetical protein
LAQLAVAVVGIVFLGWLCEKEPPALQVQRWLLKPVTFQSFVGDDKSPSSASMVKIKCATL